MLFFPNSVFSGFCCILIIKKHLINWTNKAISYDFRHCLFYFILFFLQNWLNSVPFCVILWIIIVILLQLLIMLRLQHLLGLFELLLQLVLLLLHLALPLLQLLQLDLVLLHLLQLALSSERLIRSVSSFSPDPWPELGGSPPPTDTHGVMYWDASMNL